MKKSKVEIKRAVTRLAGETLIPAEVLATEAGVSPESVIRWATHGRRGTFLDALYDRLTKRWLSSREALERFKAAFIGPTQPAA